MPGLAINIYRIPS
ncbi:hypothetical protein FG05_35062 [Fusarium graminearum]|nr:hypothetical protein FG05_35062 [Fusarium graminearum]